MDNTKILQLLEKQRDALFDILKKTTVSGLYKEQYADIKAGRVFVFDNGERQMLSDLKKLSKDTSHDTTYKNKLSEYLELDNNAIISHFRKELENVFEKIRCSEKHNDIQALFIEYDYYNQLTGNVTCYGQSKYPLIEEPRYISDEVDNNKQVLFFDNCINFQPAWVHCGELADLDYLDIDLKLENLFQLHSRVLLHKGLDILRLDNKISFFKHRPVSFYINEHDCEVMTLYWLS